jgi:hypothetical protein
MSGSILLLVLSWGLLAFGKSSVVALIAGIVVLDLGAQAMHISNQSAVCALGAGTAAVGLITWLVTERVMTGRLPIGADSSA